MAPWTEQLREGDGAALEIVVDAIDVPRTERLELASFRRALSAPEAEIEVKITRPNGSVSSSRGGLEFVRFFMFALLSLFLTGIIGKAAFFLFGELSLNTWIVILMIAFASPHAVSAYRHRPSRRQVRQVRVRDRFTLTLDASGLAVTGSESKLTQALETIERFEAGRRIALISKDGRRCELPLTLGSPNENTALTDRLNDALVDVRAGGAGYRGRGPRVELAASASDDRDAPATAVEAVEAKLTLAAESVRRSGR